MNTYSGRVLVCISCADPALLPLPPPLPSVAACVFAVRPAVVWTRLVRRTGHNHSYVNTVIVF